MNPYEETAAAAREGISRASEGAKAYRKFLTLCLVNAARAHQLLTMDEVWDEVLVYLPERDYPDGPPFNMMACGAVMQTGQKEDVIEKIPGLFRPSRRKKQHRPRQVYRSLIYLPGARITPAGIQHSLSEIDDELLSEEPTRERPRHAILDSP
jgi:hypothetical protein